MRTVQNSILSKDEKCYFINDKYFSFPPKVLSSNITEIYTKVKSTCTVRAKLKVHVY